MELAINGSNNKLSVSDAIFGREFSEDLVHQVVVAYRNAGRAGTKAQKTRAEVNGTTKKSKKQKGGGARHGALHGVSHIVEREGSGRARMGSAPGRRARSHPARAVDRRLRAEARRSCASRCKPQSAQSARTRSACAPARVVSTPTNTRVPSWSGWCQH